jgi:hypothetical protein
MKTSLLACCTAFLLSSIGFAADQYQVTGPVTELTDTKIVVEKGKEKERHEFERGADTKVTGDLKVGSKVTVHYKMIATSVESKGDAAAKADPKAKPAKADKTAK